MDSTYQVITQGTPNPNALKFIVAKDVKTKGKITYQHPAECLNVPLASNLLGVPHVTQVHLFENVITVTQDGDGDWVELESRVIETIKDELPNHNPDFETFSETNRDHLSPELQKIEDILDKTVRPGLQADGGDLEVVEFADGVLTVRYEGACGSCPSAQFGTLQGIEGILQMEYDPNIRVVAL
jgi:Fe-S cluster biogenesis protein NfuA